MVLRRRREPQREGRINYGRTLGSLRQSNRPAVVVCERGSRVLVNQYRSRQVLPLFTVHVGEHLDVLHAVEIKADVLEKLTKILL